MKYFGRINSIVWPLWQTCSSVIEQVAEKCFIIVMSLTKFRFSYGPCHSADTASSLNIFNQPSVVVKWKKKLLWYEASFHVFIFFILNFFLLFQAWSDFVNQADPDIVTGYNIVNFDFPYLLNRAIALKVKRFPFLGRILNEKSTISTTTFQSRAYGKRENKV